MISTSGRILEQERLAEKKVRRGTNIQLRTTSGAYLLRMAKLKS